MKPPFYIGLLTFHGTVYDAVAQYQSTGLSL